MILPQGYFNVLPLAYGERIVARPALGPREVAAIGGDTLTQAWRLWAVGLTHIQDQRDGQAIEWLAAASRLGASSSLLKAELNSAFGWVALRLGEPRTALGHLGAADAAWEALTEQAFDRRWPQIATLLDEQMAALDLGQPRPGDGSPSELLQHWRSTRAAAARTLVWNALADVYTRMGRTDDAVALVRTGIAWLSDRFPIGMPTQAHDLVWNLQMTLGSLRQDTVEGLEAFRAAGALYEHATWALHAEHRVGVAGLGEANTLARLGRHLEALPVYERSEAIAERWEQRPIALQCRMGALLARAELGRARELETELRALIGDVERDLGHRGSPTGFVTKADFTVAYTRLVLALAEGPASPARAEAYAGVVEALRRPEVLSDVGAELPGGWLGEVRSRVRVAAARLASRPDWCLLVLESGGPVLTFLTIRGGLGSLEERVALSTASPRLMATLEPFMQHVAAALDAAIESPTLAPGLEETELARAAEAIWEALPPAVRQVVSAARTILYAPDPFGSVDELPLEAVRAPDGWLGDTRVIARQRSVDDAIRTLAPTAPGVDRRATIVRAADPPGFAALDHADEERRLVELAGSLLGLETGVDAPASDAALQEALSRPAALIHFIGHGVADPLSEGIPMAASGALGVHDVPALSGRPVCFLNACELGRSRHIPGGGGRGLVAALRDAGASAVLAWTQAAPDRLAPLLAREFYRAARDGLPVGDALTAARARLHARGVSPAVTGCLALFGDPRAHIGPAAPAEDESWADALTRFVATRDESDRQAALARLDGAALRADVIAWLEHRATDHDAILERLVGEDLLGAAALALLDVRAHIDATRLREESAWLDLMLGLDVAQRNHATLAHASFCLDLGNHGLGKLAREQCLAHLRTAVHELEPWREASPALAALHREAVRHLRSLGGNLVIVGPRGTTER